MSNLMNDSRVLAAMVSHASALAAVVRRGDDGTAADYLNQQKARIDLELEALARREADLLTELDAVMLLMVAAKTPGHKLKSRVSA